MKSLTRYPSPTYAKYNKIKRVDEERKEKEWKQREEMC